jgi:hypothetical protein
MPSPYNILDRTIIDCLKAKVQNESQFFVQIASARPGAMLPIGCSMSRKPATSNEAIIAVRLVLQLERCRVCRSKEEY